MKFIGKNLGKLSLSSRHGSPSGRRGVSKGRPGAALGARRAGGAVKGKKAKLGFGF